MTTSTEQGSFRSALRFSGGWIVRALFNLGLGVLYLLLLWSISTQIAPGPDPRFDYPLVNTQERCEAEGGTWATDGVPVKGGPQIAPVIQGERPQPFCQGPLRVEKEREAQQREADRVSFFVFLIGGTLALVGSIPLMKMTPVAPAFLIAGVIGLLISTGKLWQFAGSLARLLTVLALLIVVAGAGSYFFREQKK